jgi:uncharacterized membrane protein
MPLWLQAIIGGLCITAAELAAGLVLGVWLGLRVWDYSALPCNLWGIVSLPYTLLWIALAGFGNVIFDWLRYLLYDEEKPHYTFLRGGYRR